MSTIATIPTRERAEGEEPPPAGSPSDEGVRGPDGRLRYEL